MVIKNSFLVVATLTLTPAVWAGPLTIAVAPPTNNSEQEVAGRALSAEPISVSRDQTHQSADDVKLTAVIQKRIKSDKKLSAQAKKVSVATVGNAVSLDGTVKNATELELIKEHVREASATSTINDKNLRVANTMSK